MPPLSPSGGSDRRPALSGPEQHEFLHQQLGRHRVSRRNVIMGSVGAVGAAFLLGNGYGSRAFADELKHTGTIADGFVVNGRHLAFGADPQRQMWVSGQLFNLNTYNAVPAGFTVTLEYGADQSYGHQVPAELRELVTHVPVWNGVPKGPVTASLTDILKADQFYVHACAYNLQPGETYHYRFRYTAGKQTGYTPDATFTTAPDKRARQPFTFTAYADSGITGAPGTGYTLDHAESLRPESSSHITNDYYTRDDPDYFYPTSKRAPTDVSPVAALIHQITKVRNPHNQTPTRFNLMAGDICYANPNGNVTAIINPDGRGGSQPGAGNEPAPPAGSFGWDDFDPYVWTSYLSNIEPSSATAPWMFATGNHDVELFSSALDADATTVGYYGSIGYGGHAQRLDLPKNGPSKCPSVYSYTYGNVAIVSVDANDLSYEIQGLLGYSEGSQSAWLKQQLSIFRADPSIDFIIAFFHHCAFSTCASHSSDGGVRAALAPLFAEFEVDLAIQGHNHLYERTNPIRYNAAANTGTSSMEAISKTAAEAAVVHPATDGTTYVVVGSAGRPRYEWAGQTETDRNFIVGVENGVNGNGTVIRGNAQTEIGPYTSQQDFSVKYETINWSQARYRDYAFIALDVVPATAGGTTTMTLRAINEHGAEFDRVVFSRTAQG